MKYVKLLFLTLIILSSCKKDKDVIFDSFPTHFTSDGEIGSYDNSAIISKDNNLIICGNQNTEGICILKITKSGELIWKTEFNKGAGCNATSIYENNQEDLFLCGSMGLTHTTLGLSNIFIVKISKDGDTLWSKTYGTSELEYGYQAIDAGDESIIISGTYEKWGTNSNCLYLVKIDFNGDTLWTRTYDNKTVGVFPYHLLKTSNGDFLLTGTYFVENGRVLYLLKFDTNGNFIWDKQIGPAWRWGYCTIELPNNNFLTCGRQNTFGTTQIMLVKTDNSGNIIWEKEYGFDDLSEEGYSMTRNSDGPITLSGSSYNAVNPDNDLLLLKIDQDGNQIWLKKFGDPRIDEWGSNLIKDINDENILFGTTFYYREDENSHETITYSRKIYMTRLDNEGNFK